MARRPASQASSQPPPPAKNSSSGSGGGLKRGATFAEAAAGYVAGLTPRQRQVFEMVLEGHPSKNIADDLGISQRTVENHRAHIMRKTKAKSLPELVRLSLAAKWFAAVDPLDASEDWNFLLDVEPITAVARTMFEYAPAAMIMIDHAGVILHMNPASEKLFGYPQSNLVGKTVDTLVPVARREEHKQFCDRFLHAPTTRPMSGGRRLTARRAGGEEIPVEIGLRPLVATGRPVIVLLTVTDKTDQERAERAELFVRELTHRAKNMFAVLLAISRQIGRESENAGSFQSAFEQRLQSFAATYRVFEAGDRRGAWIDDLIRSQLELFSGRNTKQIRIEGPKLRLRSGATEYLGLAIHELATNAFKYGALSIEGGEVEIHWAADAGARLFHFDWSEHRGPAVGEMKDKGFGSVILKRVTPSALSGLATLRGSPEGFAWHLEAPLDVVSGNPNQELA